MSNNFAAQAYESVEQGNASEAVVRAVELDKLAKAAGFTKFEGSSDGQTFFAWGTELQESGKNEFRSKAQLHSKLPFLADACGAFEKVIAAEARKDFNLPMAALFLDANRCIVTKSGSDGAPISRWAFGQLLRRANAGAALGVFQPTDDKHQKLAPAVASMLFQGYMRGAVGYKNKAIEARLRTRLNGKQKREIFAVNSPKSPVFDADQAARAFANQGHATMRGSVEYDGHRWKISAVVMSHIEPTVGEIFEGRVWISGTDDGSSSIRVGAEVVRVRCVNLTTLHAEEVESIRHQGAQLTLEQKIHAAIGNAMNTLNGFAEIWAKAEKEDIAANAQEHGARAIFEALVEKRLVHVPGVKAEEMVNRLYNAWLQEQGYTKADILNAVTRAAHMNAWDSAWVPQALADTAGQLLYQNVYVTERDFSNLEID